MARISRYRGSNAPCSRLLRQPRTQCVPTGTLWKARRHSETRSNTIKLILVVRISASALRYQPRADRNRSRRERIVAVAQRHRRYGVGMIHLKPRQAGRSSTTSVSSGYMGWRRCISDGADARTSLCRIGSVLLLASPASQHRQCGTACGGRGAPLEILSQISQCCLHSTTLTQTFTQTSRRMLFRFCTNAVFTAWSLSLLDSQEIQPFGRL
jgi:hypothetical protein